MSPDLLPDHLKFEFKNVEGLPVTFDIYLPPNTNGTPVPVIVWWRGGGLTFGDSTSWFPTWLYTRATQAGWAFISANYRLMPPGTVHHSLEDAKDLITYISGSLNNKIADQGVTVDPDRITVGGMSAGAYIAYLAALNAHPKPKAVLSLYGMGGNLIIPNFLAPKTSSFFLGTPLLDPASFKMFIYPQSSALSPISSSPAVVGETNTPAALRMNLAQFYLQLGVILDYVTGEHEPSLSAQLRPLIPDPTAAPSETVAVIKSVVPTRHHVLFPQIFVDKFPPTFFIHGNLDSVVNVRESRDLHSAIRNEGIDTVLNVLEGKEHLWDFEEQAGEKYNDVMDEAFAFLVKYNGI